MQRAEPQPTALVKCGNAHKWAESRYTMAMTMTSFLTAVLATSGISEDVATFAKAELAKIDEKNKKRRATPTAAQLDNEALMLAMVAGYKPGEVVTSAKVVADGIAKTSQKATALLMLAVKTGNMVETGKVKGVKTYAVANSEGEDSQPSEDSGE